MHNTIRVDIQAYISKERSVNMKKYQHTTKTIKDPARYLTRFRTKLSRNNLRRLINILSGHCHLNNHMHRLGVTENPTCRAC